MCNHATVLVPEPGILITDLAGRQSEKPGFAKTGVDKLKSTDKAVSAYVAV